MITTAAAVLLTPGKFQFSISLYSTGRKSFYDVCVCL